MLSIDLNIGINIANKVSKITITFVLENEQKLFLGKQARSKAVEKFSQKILIEKYQAVYEKVLNNKV